MAPFNHIVELLPFITIVFASLVLSIEFVHAQSFSPVSTGDSASAFVEGRAFYIQGGSTQQSTTNQAFSISLRSSWRTSNPIYTKLSDGLYDSQFPNALLKDGITWFAVSNNSFVTYSILDGKITKRGPASTNSTFLGLSAVLDPTLGEVIIPNGYNTNGVQTTTMYISLEDMIARTNSQPDFFGLVRYSLAWSGSAQKMFLFGGSVPSGLAGALMHRRTSTFWGNWTSIDPVVGDPSARESACMVPAFNGAKLILFGGSGPTASSIWNVALSDIYIYDVATLSWTKGTDAGSTRARSSHACAVSGDALIVWGGFSDPIVKTTPSELVAIYNLTTNTWVDKFIAPINDRSSFFSLTGPPNVTTGTGSVSIPVSATSGSGDNSSAIIIGIVAAAVVLTGLGFVVWRRCSLKKRAIFSNTHHQQSDGESHGFKEPPEKIKYSHNIFIVPPAPQSVPQNVRQSQLRTPWQEHERYQQSNEGLYDYRDHARNNDHHGDLCVQRAPQIHPRATNSFRSPQLDIWRRERELVAELEMLRSDRGNVPIPLQRADNWSTHRSGGGSPHA